MSTADESPQETFISHLVELRSRLLKSIVAVLVVFLALAPFSKDIYSLVARPLMHALPVGATMIATDVTGTFLVPLKVTLLAAFLVALPWVLWQIWAFVAPGLYKHEQRLALPLIVSSVVLFFAGMAFAYFVVFPWIFHFFVSFTPEGVQMMTDIDKYLSFVLWMFVAFGATFEIPVVEVLLVRMGIVSLDKLKSQRRYVIVGAFIVAAVITPPDVVSQLMLAVPMCLLYEIGLVAARFFPKPDADAVAGDDVKA
ncbi:MAG TPA: twin-arginine translocase subunit TatC [Casimicrobiaceae bacterium]|jgi:sec-independent protein translocase protein TatC|nr:twin-arginine translocase subunit TatC [Casimicrobiaceae bacterium]